MDNRYKYKNRTEELNRLTKILKSIGISNVEELSKLLMRTIQSYALQINIEPLTPREIEYVWIKLIG